MALHFVLEPLFSFDLRSVICLVNRQWGLLQSRFDVVTVPFYKRLLFGSITQCTASYTEMNTWIPIRSEWGICVAPSSHLPYITNGACVSTGRGVCAAFCRFSPSLSTSEGSDRVCQYLNWRGFTRFNEKIVAGSSSCGLCQSLALRDDRFCRKVAKSLH